MSMQKIGANNMQTPRTVGTDASVGRPAGGARASREADLLAFRERLGALTKELPAQPAAIGGRPAAQGPGPLKFSNHAVERMQTRGIRFSPEELGRIQTAVGKAAGKGSRESLLITDNAALIVSVKDNTVVTVMDKASLKQNVFTNIDSTVMI
jgi:flagellar operon protein